MPNWGGMWSNAKNLYSYGLGKTGGLSGIGRMVGNTAMGRYGSTAAGALWGAGIGGAYGAFSDKRSILGGMTMGAGLGAGGARYLGAGFRAGSTVGSGMGLGAHARAYGKAFGQGVLAQGKTDYRNMKALVGRGFNSIQSNSGFNKIRGIF